ncbi:hypothetical protein [Algicola sagamiensis]|uniref:hypothetical protein n=1 Tax=Algicola sagamiensis TaxID=163869 RepID=UPI00036F6323|nr:hypothetical protein [Algicola sagamiensis]
MYKRQLLQFATSILATTLLFGCGSDDNNNPEKPESIIFPVQVNAPSVINLDEAGSVLTTESGRSLYVFDKDMQDVSNCHGAEGDEPGSTLDAASCAGIWPPLLIDSSAQVTAPFSTIERKDGTKQWAYLGYPLYTFIKDKKQGDISGDGVKDVWHLARKTPVKVTDDGKIVGQGIIHSATLADQVLQEGRLNKDGFALYTFDKDPVGQAACYTINDDCINIWPPLLADPGSKPKYPFSVLSLANGKKQWAYQSKPLYFFANDNTAGDANGDGVGGVWHLADITPAIFRESNLGPILSATGEVMALLPEKEGSSNFTVQTVDKDQFTLYTFDNDALNESKCEGICAEKWPPFIANEADVRIAPFTKIQRADGHFQWAWKGQPLYFYFEDENTKDTNGDGVGGVWHVILDENESSES